MEHWRWLLHLPRVYPWSALGSLLLTAWLVLELGALGLWFVSAITEVVMCIALVNAAFSLGDLYLMNLHRLASQCVYTSRLLRVEFVLSLLQALALWTAVDTKKVVASAVSVYLLVEIVVYWRQPASRSIEDDEAWKTSPGFIKTLQRKAAAHAVLLFALILHVGPSLSVLDPQGAGSSSALEEVETQ